MRMEIGAVSAPLLSIRNRPTRQWRTWRRLAGIIPVLYNLVRTSCNATDVIVSLMYSAWIQRGSDDKVADEGPTTSLVVRDFTFSKIYCWRFKSSEMLRRVFGQIASGDSNYRSAFTFRIKQWEFSARSEAALTSGSLLQTFATKRTCQLFHAITPEWLMKFS
jgi:hypothetical protein